MGFAANGNNAFSETHPGLNVSLHSPKEGRMATLVPLGSGDCSVDEGDLLIAIGSRRWLARAGTRRPLLIGRHPQADISLDHKGISREHLLLRKHGQHWRALDQESTNGCHLVLGGNDESDTVPFTSITIDESIRIRLGHVGPVIDLTPIRSSDVLVGEVDALDVSREGRGRRDEDASRGSGRAAVSHAGRMPKPGAIPRSNAGRPAPAFPLGPGMRKVPSLFWVAAASLSMLMVALGLYRAVHLRHWIGLKTGAGDVHSGGREDALEEEGHQGETVKGEGAGDQARGQRRAGDEVFVIEQGDGRFLPMRNREEQLIFRMARIFGEVDREIPLGFINGVKEHIVLWKKNPGRLERAVRRAKRAGLIDVIVDELVAAGLTPYFFYMGLQESNYFAGARGPLTRHGQALGCWQFMPETARRFGLVVPVAQGPVSATIPDERLDCRKSTRAAAAYLKALFEMDVGNSGLLVMAAYNWGEKHVIKRLHRADELGEPRTFFTFASHRWLPDETYDYVYRIVAAAVIGDDPAAFGFDFENPLIHAPGRVLLTSETDR